MARRSRALPHPSAHDVFLNIPYDRAYEKQFLALIAAVVAVGRTPRCVLEVLEDGSGRLVRIFELLQRCGISLHDLSRVGLPVRFNMPFELGLACAIAELNGNHLYVLLEREPRRLDRTLSDLAGRDPYIHRGRVRGTIGAVLEVLQSAGRHTEPDQVLRVYRELCRGALELKRRYGVDDVFKGHIFRRLVALATVVARDEGILERG